MMWRGKEEKRKKKEKTGLPLFIREREKIGEKGFVRRWLEEGS
jgi:hypothetical protein